MHEFILYGQIPYRKHHQILNGLAGATGARPKAYHEQHLIYEPSLEVWKASNAGVIRKKNQQNSAKQQRYLHDVYREIKVSIDADVDTTWKLLAAQEPEPGSPNMISRSYTVTDISDASQFDNANDYKLHGHHLRSGHYFVLGNVVVRIFRVLLASDAGKVSTEAPAPSIEPARLFDLSGTYVVEASIRMEDRTNSKLADQASKELLDVKKMLQGIIELIVPDRLSLDTRVK